MGTTRPPIVEKARALFDVSNMGTITAGNIADNTDLQRVAAESNAPTEQEQSILNQYAK